MKTGVLVFLGPGRSGTTSIYHAFKSSGHHLVMDEKECGPLTFGSDAVLEELRAKSERGLLVETTPSNLFFSECLSAGVSRLDVPFAGYVLVVRPIADRMKSLYLHHRKIGSFEHSFDEFVERCLDLYESPSEWPDDPQDLTYIGLCEYHPSHIANLRDGPLHILRFDSLFSDLNTLLERLGSPPVEEHHRNVGFQPRFALLHRALLLIYRVTGLRHYSGLDRVKKIYARVNAHGDEVRVSPTLRKTLQRIESRWMEGLGSSGPGI